LQINVIIDFDSFALSWFNTNSNDCLDRTDYKNRDVIACV